MNDNFSEENPIVPQSQENEIQQTENENDLSSSVVTEEKETAQIEAPKKTNLKNQNGFAIFIVVVIVAAICGLYSIINSIVNPESSVNQRVDEISSINKSKINPFNSTKVQENVVGSFTNDYIAILDITGSIQAETEVYNQKWLLDTIDDLKEDDFNKGILLAIDSPGGSVYESDEMYLKLMEYKAETGKTIWAYFKSMAASGGYYIGCAADYIVANRNTLTGSIGVIYGPAIDLTKLMEKYGIESSTFTAGKNKNMLNFDSPVTEEQAEIMQSVVDEAYDQFTQIVADSRNLPIKTVQKIADGRIYTALQAKENKLIDEIMGYEEVIEYMKKDLFGENHETVTFEHIEYYREKNFYEMLMYSKSNLLGTPQSAESMLINEIMSRPQGLLYYFEMGE